MGAGAADRLDKGDISAPPHRGTVAGGPSGGLVSMDMPEPVTLDIRQSHDREVNNLLDEPRAAWDGLAAGLRETVRQWSIERHHVEPGRPKPSPLNHPASTVGIPADLEPVRRLENPVRVTVDDEGGRFAAVGDGTPGKLPGMIVGQRPGVTRGHGLKFRQQAHKAALDPAHGHPRVAMIRSTHIPSPGTPRSSE